MHGFLLDDFKTYPGFVYRNFTPVSVAHVSICPYCERMLIQTGECPKCGTICLPKKERRKRKWFGK